MKRLVSGMKTWRAYQHEVLGVGETEGSRWEVGGEGGGQEQSEKGQMDKCWLT